MIQHAIEEIVCSGIKKACIVIRSQKEVIKEYFLSRDAQKQDMIVEEAERLVSKLEISFVYQHRPLGLGDALLAARDFVGNKAFVMVIPDQILYSGKPATLQLLEQYVSDQSAIWSSLIRPSPREAAYFTGPRGVRCGKFDGNVCKIMHDSPPDTRFQGFGRTILQPAIFRFIEKQPDLDYVSALLECGKQIPRYGVLLEGIPFDFGIIQGYYRYLPKI